MYNDPDLEKYKDEIYALERSITHAIFYFSAMKQE
jgi:hypothetical protein